MSKLNVKTLLQFLFIPANFLMQILEPSSDDDMVKNFFDWLIPSENIASFPCHPNKNLHSSPNGY
jgi:hypothetical protein